jgi:hypothetical protein
VLLGEARIGLAAAAQGQAGRDAGNAQARRKDCANKVVNPCRPILLIV